MNEDNEAIAAEWTGARDSEAFRVIFVRYSTMVYATCRRILPTESDAEEVAQECFETLALRNSAPTGYLGPWLHRVATNLSLKRIRTDTRRHKREDRFAREQETESDGEWDDVYRFVDEAMAELPEKFRIAVVARYLEARTLDSIAQELNLSPRTVAYRVEKGVTMIRRALRKRGIIVSAATLGTMMATNLAEASVVPSTLTAALGKLAIASPGGAFTVGAAKTIGGLMVMKNAGITAVVLLGAAVAYWSVEKISTESTPEIVELSQTPGETSSPNGMIPPSDDNPDEASRQNDASDPSPSAAQETPAAIEEQDAEDDIEPIDASIVGLVHDLSTRMGLEGVIVTATSDDDVFETKTGPMGRFELAGLTPGIYEITSEVPGGYFPSTEPNVVHANLGEGAIRTGVDFGFHLGGTMEGVITRGSEPAASKTFEVSHNPGLEESYVEYIETDEVGAYTLTGLIPGGRQVQFRSTDEVNQSHKMPVIIDAGETTVVDVHFIAGSASVEGVVFRDEHTPVEAKIEVHALEHIFYATSNEDGYYKIDDLPAGQVQLLGFSGSDDDADAPVQRKIFALDLDEGQQLVQDIWFTETTIACQVSDIPESNFEVFVTALKGEVDFSKFNILMLGTITRQRAAIGEVSVDGTGTLKNLEPGTYTIVAISFPSNPSAIEALSGDELRYFMQNLSASNAEVVTIEAATGEVSVDLTFE